LLCPKGRYDGVQTPEPLGEESKLECYRSVASHPKRMRRFPLPRPSKSGQDFDLVPQLEKAFSDLCKSHRKVAVDQVCVALDEEDGSSWRLRAGRLHRSL
jgi:hypothetical protein